MVRTDPLLATRAVLETARAQLEAAGIESAALTSLILLEQVAGLTRERLLAHPEQTLPSENVTAFEQAIQRRCRSEPLAYILGWREFYGRRFAVSPATLIPRPETEGVVERVLPWLQHHQTLTTTPLSGLSALDVGTGSGAIAVSLLAEIPSLQLAATDSSLAALRVAQTNARAHGVQDRLRLVACDLAAGLRGPFALVAANLPYIPSNEIASLQPEIAFEPCEALDGGPDGTVAIQRLLRDLPRLLIPGGLAVLEIGHDQGPLLTKWAAMELADWRISVEPDAAGCDRYLLLERPNT